MSDVALARRQVSIADAIGAAPDRVRVRWVGTGKAGREERPRFHVGKPVKLPAANDLVYHRRSTAEKLAPLAEGQLPEHINADAIANRVRIAAPTQRGIGVLEIQHVVVV